MYKKFLGLNLILLFSLLLISGCSQSEKVTIYYPINLNSNKNIGLVKESHNISETDNKPKAALNQLIHGKPHSKESYSVIPKETKIIDVSINARIATVDFSREVLDHNSGAEGESLGINSIVFTLTEFDNINKVKFTVEGKEKGTVGGKYIENWWGHVTLSKQPFERDSREKIIEP